MNLMFRKNFREGGSSSKSSGGSKLSKMNRTGKRSRDMSCSGPSTDEGNSYYRTHIFFSPNRGNYQDTNEGCQHKKKHSFNLGSGAQKKRN